MENHDIICEGAAALFYEEWTFTYDISISSPYDFEVVLAAGTQQFCWPTHSRSS